MSMPFGIPLPALLRESTGEMGWEACMMGMCGRLWLWEWLETRCMPCMGG